MSNINQLLAKALSTSSEDEAIACLRMARKKGGRLEDSGAPAEYHGHDAKYWYDKAAMYYMKAKEKYDGLTQQKLLFKMYVSERDDAIKLRREKHTLDEEIRKLKSQPKGTWKLPVIFLQAFIIIVLLLQFTG